ncbi:MAG: DUF1592 domain-containing protein, partial [Planctomycetes bacterium]|nr:DUF1592 domain-containing protein [Planctomycetota bacterium]
GVGKKLLPKDGAAGEGFTNVGMAQGLPPSQLESYLDAARAALEYLRVDPVSGAEWSADGIGTIEDPKKRRLELSMQMVKLFTATHAAVLKRTDDTGLRAYKLNRWNGPRPRMVAHFHAAWRYRYRQELGLADMDAVVTSLKKDLNLDVSPVFVERWVELMKTPHKWKYAQRVIDQWNALPGPKEMEEQEVLLKIKEIIVKNSPYIRMLQVSYAGLEFKFKNYEEGNTTRTKIKLHGTWPMKCDVSKYANKNIYLVTAEGGTTNEEDAMYWQDATIQFKDGSKKTVAEAGIEWRSESGDVLDPDDQGRVRVQAPTVIVLKMPANAAQFHVTAYVEKGKKASVQPIVLGQAPTEEMKHFIPRRGILGEGGREVTGYLIALRNWGDRLDTGGNLSHHLTTPWPYLQDHPQLTDLIDKSWGYKRATGKHKDFGGDPHRPYNISVEDHVRMMDEVQSQRHEQILKELSAAAQSEHQALRRALEGAGIKNIPEGVLPEKALLKDLDQEVQDQLKVLMAAVAAKEKEFIESAKSIIQSFAQKAWSRPVKSDELELLIGLYQQMRSQGAAFDGAVKEALTVVLISPQFLFQDNDASSVGSEGAIVTLNARDLARRMSFVLWGSLPDEELLSALAKFSDAVVINKQVERMLKDPRVEGMAEEFFGQWFGFAGFSDNKNPDLQRFPMFNQKLATAMHQESLLFTSTLLSDNRPLSDLISADYTYLNESLAKNYGITDKDVLNKIKKNKKPRSKTAIQKLIQVPLSDARRGGIVSMGTSLVTTSSPLRTSPVKRGDWVVEKLLGYDIPPPPDDVGALSDDVVDKKGRTIAEQLADHRNKPACMACHQRIDPPGLALENYDPIGRWRTKDDADNPVASLTEIKGKEIKGVVGLKQWLMEKEQQQRVIDSFCRHLCGYALGRGVMVTDQPLLERMDKALRENELRPLSAVQILINSPQFRNRRNQEFK